MIRYHPYSIRAGDGFRLVLTTALGPSALLYYENTGMDQFVANKFALEKGL